jgi:transcriptional regulator with GAF, ATPase, and Fis domain
MMQPEKDARFDPNFATRLLVDIAHEQSVERLLQKLVQGAMDRPDVVCVQVWLVNKGDRCAVCPQKPNCPNQARCLHLVAGGGKSSAVPAGSSPQFDDPTLRTPIGVGVIGQIAESKRQLTVKNLHSNPGTQAEFQWLKRDGVRGFSGSAITFKGELLGVTCAFVRDELHDEAVPWGQIFADHIGAAIANARAFEEIQRLRAQLEQQNSYLQEEVIVAKAYGALVGQSAALRQIISQIDLVAPTEASVLILGDTGTGKDLVAHEIHRRSRRKDSPFIRVNCGSVPRELFESEFFGHVKGAFTGAIKDRPGRFETAEGGTLFLDEIGELPMETQAKLLRVLQDKMYERVGDDRTRHADVRIIAATNRDLKKQIASGRFREDLFYRLHIFPIHVPSLKERKEDIPLLAAHFVDLSVKELRCARPRLTRAAVVKLQSYDWPGNVRELRNVIERAVILARGRALQFDVPADHAPAPSKPAAPSVREGDCLTELEMRQRERANTLAVLERTHWKVKGADGAAEFLGVKPTTLLARMQKMGIKRVRG